MTVYRIHIYKHKNYVWRSGEYEEIHAVSPYDVIWKAFGVYEFYDNTKYVKVVPHGTTCSIITIQKKEGETWKKVSFKAM